MPKVRSRLCRSQVPSASRLQGSHWRAHSLAVLESKAAASVPIRVGPLLELVALSQAVAHYEDAHVRVGYKMFPLP